MSMPKTQAVLEAYKYIYIYICGGHTHAVLEAVCIYIYMCKTHKLCWSHKNMCDRRKGCVAATRRLCCSPVTEIWGCGGKAAVCKTIVTFAGRPNLAADFSVLELGPDFSDGSMQIQVLEALGKIGLSFPG